MDCQPRGFLGFCFGHAVEWMFCSPRTPFSALYQKYSTTCIELPFRVIETSDPEKQLQGDNSDGSRVLHVHLESFEEPAFKKAKIEDVVFI